MGRRKALTQKQEQLISIAWKQVEQFIVDWQKSPHEWENEIDVQVELASRIKNAYRGRGWHTVWGKYTKHVAERFKGKKQFYPRVSCEPPIYYQVGKKRQVCKPDIVVWDDIQNPEHPEYAPAKRKNDRMLWICELKYMPAWKKPYSPTREDNWDYDKVKRLLQQSDGAEAGCWLNIAYRVDGVSEKKFNGKPSKQGRFREYLVTLPVEAHSKEEILGMIDKGVFDKFILKDIAKATGIGYKELCDISKDCLKKSARK